MTVPHTAVTSRRWWRNAGSASHCASQSASPASPTLAMTMPRDAVIMNGRRVSSVPSIQSPITAVSQLSRICSTRGPPVTREQQRRDQHQAQREHRHRLYAPPPHDAVGDPRQQEHGAGDHREPLADAGRTQAVVGAERKDEFEEQLRDEPPAQRCRAAPGGRRGGGAVGGGVGGGLGCPVRCHGVFPRVRRHGCFLVARSNRSANSRPAARTSRSGSWVARRTTSSMAARIARIITHGSKSQNSPAPCPLRICSTWAARFVLRRVEEGVRPGVARREVPRISTMRREVVRVLGEQVEVALDGGAQAGRVALLGLDTGAGVRLRDPQHLGDDLAHQVAPAVEVVGDHPRAAQPGALRDLRERGPVVTGLGDDVDRRGDDLSAAARLREGGPDPAVRLLLGRAVSCLHEQEDSTGLLARARRLDERRAAPYTPGRGRAGTGWSHA